MRKNGFTLLELMVSTAMLSVVSVLGFIVIQSSYESQALIEARGRVDHDLRSVMSALTTELELAYTKPRVATVQRPDGVDSVVVTPDQTQITFYRPAPDNSPRGYRWAGPIVFEWHNEDIGPDGGNARLDDGEDTNHDGVLNRRMLRIEDGETRVVGAANTLSNVQFTLLESPGPGDDRFTSVHIRLEASEAYGPRENQMVRSALEARVRFLNAGAAS